MWIAFGNPKSLALYCFDPFPPQILHPYGSPASTSSCHKGSFTVSYFHFSAHFLTKQWGFHSPPSQVRWQQQAVGPVYWVALAVTRGFPLDVPGAAGIATSYSQWQQTLCGHMRHRHQISLIFRAGRSSHNYLSFVCIPEVDLGFVGSKTNSMLKVFFKKKKINKNY